jgi:glucokinase
VFDSRDPTVTQAAPYPRLLGDIGGTNARFGWQTHEGAEISRVQVLPCAEHASLLGAVQHYLRLQCLAVPPCAAFGIANPVTGDQVSMTNHHWTFSVMALREGLGLARLLLLNDFTALALSLTQLPQAHKQQIGGGQAIPRTAIGLIGPGTGLGVSGLLPVGQSDQWLPLVGEGGHVSLSAANAHEFAVIQQLQKRHGHVSAERVLSGVGLVDLHHALCEINGGPGQDINTPAEVLARAQALPLSAANEALNLFCGFLGSVAGDLALTLGARGGLYIGGGIVPRLGARFDASPFRARFEDKGRFKNYLQSIPVWVIHSPVSPALQGASQALALLPW